MQAAAYVAPCNDEAVRVRTHAGDECASLQPSLSLVCQKVVGYGAHRLSVPP